MAVAQKGVGVVWGVDGVTYTGFSVGSEPACKNTSVNGEKTAQRREILDGNGELAGQVFYDARRKFSISVIPSGTTMAIAKANVNKYLPAIGTVITVVDGDNTIFDGDYSLLSAKLNRSNTGEATIDMELEMSEVNTATTAIST